MVEKFKEVIISVLPITVIVLLLHLTLVPLEATLLIRFMMGSLFIIIGLTLFLLGVDLGVTPLGNHVGETITRMNKLWVVVVFALVLGFFISIAEPGLLIFGKQVETITLGQVSRWVLLGAVSIGIASFLVVGFIRIIFNVPLYIILSILYGFIFVLALFTESEMIVIAFDASGATTGVLAVPFILALAYGISHLKKDTKAGEKDSFGTIAIVSAGAVIAVMLFSIVTPARNYEVLLEYSNIESGTVIGTFSSLFWSTLNDSLMALLPILVIFILFQTYIFKFTTRVFIRILKGFVYVLIGLILFLLGVYAGFMDVGAYIGAHLAVSYAPVIIVSVGFLLGIVTILAEPAVHILTQQIEETTSGYVTKISVLTALALGVGLAVAITVLRVFVGPLQIWHILLPGYLIALSLMYVVPKVFVGIAYDAGGVATGPMTATFILAFTQGAAQNVPGAHPILDGLGMIALVALTPIITLQILGYIFKVKSRKKAI